MGLIQHADNAATAIVKKWPVAILRLIVLLAGTGIVSAAMASPPFNSSTQCKALAHEDFSTIPDAPTEITETAVVENSDEEPAYCRIKGFVSPQVGIELRLPLTGWNGKFLKIGCGALCGVILADQCAFAVRRGYACIASNMGHSGAGYDGKWAYNNLQAKIDFAYRGTHVAALAGKAITARYYQQAPRKSYFVGCSQGGRQGLVEAQRFPWDFDGIIAGAPVIRHTLSGLHLLWATQLLQSTGKAPLLGPEVVNRLHKLALSQCDREDGISDGLISNPQACNFKPDKLACLNSEGRDCLTDVQMSAVRQLYSGAATSEGEKLYWRAMPGSELNWLGALIKTADESAYLHKFSVELFKYLVFVPDPGPQWDPAKFNLDDDYRRFGMTESLYDASNPDLRRFKAVGGKLLLYQGWTDALVPPEGVIDYYQTVQRTMGGPTATRDFARLFLLPGVDHCVGGAGANAIDYLTYMENWVEHGKAPDRLLSAHLKKEGPSSIHQSFPLNPDDVSFFRPVYPYPSWTKYTGAGDPKHAESFEPATNE